MLDVASGPGYMAAKAADRGASVVGVDIAEAMTALAGRLHPQLEFVHGDAQAQGPPGHEACVIRDGAGIAGFYFFNAGSAGRARARWELVTVP
jgi:SAM-dependent methyltransferase